MEEVHVSNELASRKREQLLAELKKRKWWNKKFDPRDLEIGDIIKTRGSKLLRMAPPHFTPDGLNKHAHYALGEYAGIPSHIKPRGSEYNPVFMQPGFTAEVLPHSGSVNGLAFTSDVFVSTRHLGYYEETLIEYNIPEFIRVDIDLMNKMFADSSALNVYASTYPWKEQSEVFSRANEIDSTETNYEAFARIIEQLDDDRLVPIYSWLVTLFQLDTYSLLSPDNIKYLKEEAAQYIQWGEKFAGKAHKFEPHGTGFGFGYIRTYVEELKELGIDPNSNRLNWSKESEWSRGDFEIAPLHGGEDYLRQGHFLRQCISSLDEQPYLAMAEAGHWQNFTLRSRKNGRPLASICVAIDDNGDWSVLENRGTSNVSLAPGSEAREKGKPAQYAKIIDTWLETVEAEHNISVDRSDENVGYAPVHELYGLRAHGYSPNFYEELRPGRDMSEWDREEIEDWRDGQLGSISPKSLGDIEDYLDEMKTSPEHFLPSEEWPDEETEVFYYYPGNELEISATSGDDFIKIIDEMIETPLAQRDESKLYRYIIGMDLLIRHADAASYNWRGSAEGCHDGLIKQMLDYLDSYKPHNDMKESELGEDSSSDQARLDIVIDDRVEYARAIKELITKVASLEGPAHRDLPILDYGSVNGLDVDDYISKTTQQMKGLEVNNHQSLPELDRLFYPRLADDTSTSFYEMNEFQKRVRWSFGESQITGYEAPSYDDDLSM